MSEDKHLQEVTSQTLKAVSRYDVILPELYTSVFKEKDSQKQGRQSDLEEGISEALNKMRKYESVVHDNGIALHKGLIKAHEAIESHDLKLLDQVQNEVTRLRDELVLMRKELYQDALTRIYNRKWLIEHYTDNGICTHEGILVFFDLNSFKAINDTHGHLIGDRVLKLFSSYLKELKPAYPVRYGGDEFLLLCDKHSTLSCEEMIETLSQSVKKQLLNTHKGDRFRISFA